jgi:hypothetical protein
MPSLAGQGGTGGCTPFYDSFPRYDTTNTYLGMCRTLFIAALLHYFAFRSHACMRSAMSFLSTHDVVFDSNRLLLARPLSVLLNLVSV